jgi:hypothetical protein
MSGTARADEVYVVNSRENDSDEIADPIVTCPVESATSERNQRAAAV